MAAVNVAVSIDVAELTVAHHCEHDDDVHSWRLVEKSQDLTCYLRGTPEQVSEFALRLAKTVSEHCVRQVELAMHGEAS